MLLISAVLLIIILIIWKQYQYYTFSFKIPGPMGLPILGIALSIRSREEILPYLVEMKKQFGSILFSHLLLFKPVLVTTNPELIEKILTSHSFLNKSIFYNAFRYFTGNGLIVSNGPTWYKHRKLLKPAFNHKLIISFFPIFNNGIKICVEKLEKFSNQNEGIDDLLGHLLRCTVDVSIQTTMGENINFQNNVDSPIPNAVTGVFALIIDRASSPWLYNDWIFKLSSLYKPTVACIKILEKFRNTILEKKIHEFDSIKLKNNINNDGIIKPSNIFIDQALLLFNDKKFDLTDVKSESLTMIAASVETGAVTLNSILTLLAMHPEYQEKLFQDILAVFPDKKFDVNYDDLKNIPYVDQIINESLRIFPTVPLIGRYCSTDFNIGNNIIIPKGTEAYIDIFNLHRDEEIWGKNAKKFYPDHFLTENIKNIHPYAFLPFSKGMRNCLGWEYALLAAKIMLVHLIRNYEFSTEFKLNDVVIVEAISIEFKEHPSIRIKKRLI